MRSSCTLTHCRPPDKVSAPRVAILLSTYNGAQHVTGQLASLRGQTLPGWRLYWRDDGSSDATPALMRAFIDELGAGRVVVLPGEGRVGATESFLRLLRAAASDNDIVCFCDQDDIWLPHKLEHGVSALHQIAGDIPALYCARQVLVDEELRRIGLSPVVHRVPSFPAPLAQNIATGCTLMLNRRAAQLVATSRAPASAFHDWWCYLLVSAGGGEIRFDARPVVLYRQHGENAVGAPATLLRRGVAALRRGPRPFATLLRQHVAALLDQPQLLSPSARAQLNAIADALGGGKLRRLAVLPHGLNRQTWPETLLFRLWFVLA